MSGVAIVRYLLANNSGLVATVPSTRIAAGVVPIKTAIPAISITSVSSVQRNIVAMNEATSFVTERVQVTVLSKGYAETKSVLILVRGALPVSRGIINGYNCDSILPDTEGPDIYDNMTEINEQSLDFMIKFTR